MPKRLRFKLNGQPFSLRFVREDMLADGNMAECGPPRTDGKTRHIWIADNVPEKEELELCIHELLHATCWDLDEGVVERGAREMAAVLWRLGWRKRGSA